MTVRLTTCEEGIKIEVSDTGRGVPEELSARIFTDGFTTKAPDGRSHRGIGLALVHRLVSRAGGPSRELLGRHHLHGRAPTKARSGVEVGA